MATLVQALRDSLERKGVGLPVEVQRVMVKEYLQAYVLDFLYNHPDYRHLNFYGGSCLHAVYHLNRLSEDIDLDNTPEIALSALPEDLKAYFSTTIRFPEVGLHTQISAGDILRITLKFPLLKELGLSSHADENLHLKVEISQHKQTAIIQHTPILYHGRSFVPSHFSLETMMAGKMLACIERTFAVGKTGIDFKGRDYYDLLWFMTGRVWPLEEKLAKDGEEPYTVLNAFSLIQSRVEKISVTDLAYDLRPLFAQGVFIQSWLESFHENFLRLVQPYLAG